MDRIDTELDRFSQWPTPERITARKHLLPRKMLAEVVFLPSYSPNRNLIERLWKFVKKEVLNSRHHQDFQTP